MTLKENEVDKKRCIEDVPAKLNNMHELYTDEDDSINDKVYMSTSDSSELIETLNNGKQARKKCHIGTYIL